jgi:UDP-glucose 4-epimerase
VARTVLVTGGAGFIGSHIVDGLVARGDHVRVFDNLSTGRLANLADSADRIEILEGDLTRPDEVARAVRGVEVIFHQAALPSVPISIERPLDTHASCVTGTIVLLDAARRAGVRRVVYAASSSAYGDLAACSKRETDLPEPISPYGAAKLAAEYYCRAFAATFPIETVCLRYFNVFGPRQDPNSPYSAVIPLFITHLLEDRSPTVYGDGRQSRDFTYVADVVRGNLLAADAPGVSGRVLNLACGRSIDLLTLLAELGRLLGTPRQAIHAPPRAGDIKESLADITEARRLLGYEPRYSLEEGLRLSIDYYRASIESRRLATAGA